MHILFAVRGINQQVDLWKKFMETQMFIFRQKPILKDDKGNFLKNPDGTYQYGAEMLTKVQGALRPIEFYEYVFPEESYAEVMAMLGIHKECLDTGFKLRPEMSIMSWVMRKMLGYQKMLGLPEEIRNKESYQITDKWIPNEAVANYPLGIRRDPKKDFIFGDKGYYQEGL